MAEEYVLVGIVEVMRKNLQVYLAGEAREGAEDPGVCYTRSQLKKGISQEGISPFW